MVDARDEIFIFWLPKAQENTFLDTFYKNIVFCHKCFFFQQKSGGAIIIIIIIIDLFIVSLHIAEGS